MNGRVANWAQKDTTIKLQILSIRIESGRHQLYIIGCKAIQERKAKRIANNLAEDNSKCTGMGFEKGTDSYRLCMMNLETKRETLEAASLSCNLDGGVLINGSCYKSIK